MYQLHVADLRRGSEQLGVARRSLLLRARKDRSSPQSFEHLVLDREALVTEVENVVLRPGPVLGDEEDPAARCAVAELHDGVLEPALAIREFDCAREPKQELRLTRTTFVA